ncbi:SIR2 family protein [Roseateles asaccharophilus]|uniref:SIR2-like domain-containing protein n=1 Tax=Roseateles asaccharophilus TaxID=582607 RepID=A0ABU2AEK0_9BURK|nr:SIR2 family protein [Roseateles asaccharophilus]MDR7335633.1 hypothetical protein [Roseateles asaccharophilus]
MIDPTNSLAFSMQANKGVYAILLGSGVSRAAQIPTGWEVTIELVRKAAAIQKADCEPNPAAWYRSSTGSDPDYSVLLDAVAKTPAERQQLLRPYFEPTEEQREKGEKAPTKAHRAIARLVKLGYVRVVVTTNFDRLLEVALADVGIQPTVLSTADQIAGAMPLVHTACTVIKVHGDYLDTRILNTPEELATYPDAFNTLLDRVFDEFGLVVSGWSADWDVALKAAIVRAPNRRFSTYWSSRGEPSATAADLIARRAGTLVRSPDADSFFTALAEQVQALEDFAAPHPLSSAAAVAALKRYLTEPKHRIALNDLVRREVDQVVDATSGARFDLNQPTPDADTLLARLKSYEAASQTLVQLAYHAGYWSDEAQTAPWVSALRRLAQQPAGGGYELWTALRRYPAAMLLYSFGVGAIQSGNFNALRVLFKLRLKGRNDEEKSLGMQASLWPLGGDKFQILKGRERRHTPLHEHTSQFLFDQLKRSFDNEADFAQYFDEFEVILALHVGAEQVDPGEYYWAPPGPYCWRTDNLRQTLVKIRASLATGGNGSPYITACPVGKDVAAAETNIAGLEGFIGRIGWSWR